MTHPARHELDLCPDCDGLRTTTLTHVPGITHIEIESDHQSLTYTGPATIYIGPTPAPCPNRDQP